MQFCSERHKIHSAKFLTQNGISEIKIGKAEQEIQSSLVQGLHQNYQLHNS